MDALCTHEDNECADDDYDYFIRLMVIGDSSVGKTSFLCKYAHGSFNPRMATTVGIDFQQKRIVRESTSKIDKRFLEEDGNTKQRIQLQLWDTAGQERYRSLCTVILRDSMGFFLMFDLTNENSFYNCREWMSLLAQHAYCENPDIVLVGNKYDMISDRQVTRSAATSLAEEFGIPYIETSAATGYQVNEAVECLLNRVMEKAESIPIPEKGQFGDSSGLKSSGLDRSCAC